MPKLNHKIVNSITEITRAEWEPLFGDIAEGYDFFMTLEESNLENFTYHYVLVYENNTIRLIAPLFISEFNMDIVMDGPAKKLVRFVRTLFPRFLIMKTLFCGSPFGENGIIGIDKNSPDKDAVIDELIRALNRLSAEKKAPFTVFKDFLAEDLPVLKRLKAAKFFLSESFPSVVVDLNFNSIEEYMAGLSYNSRKALRRKIKKTNALPKIEITVADDPNGLIDDIYGLYLNTYNAGWVKFEKLTREFFIRIADNFKGRTKFFLYYLDGKLVAFNLCLIHNDLLIDKFIGFDYDVAYKYNLYYISWCYNIEWCLKNSIHHYQVGQTDYHPKKALGGRIIPLYAYARHRNAAVNRFLRILSALLASSETDKDAKDEKK